jgi:hypothetical protein
MLTIILILAANLCVTGCEMPPEKVRGASESPTFRQGDYMPTLERWNTESKATNRQWYEVLLQTRGVEGRELVGYYQKCRKMKYLPPRPGEKEKRKIFLNVHFVYPVNLKEKLGYFTENGRTCRYIWNDREKREEFVALTSHEDALKLLLNIPVDKPILIKPASRREEFMWYDYEFHRK